MRQLWSDIRRHPRSAALFLVYWLAAWVITFLTWMNGMSPLATSMHLLAPVIAGGLVGWWRAPAREGLLVGRGHLAGGPLAAALLMLASITVIFAADGVGALLRGTWKWEAVVEWLGWCAIFGLFALVLGLFGSFLGAMLARVTHGPTSQ